MAPYRTPLVGILRTLRPALFSRILPDPRTYLTSRQLEATAARYGERLPLKLIALRMGIRQRSLRRLLARARLAMKQHDVDVDRLHRRMAA